MNPFPLELYTDYLIASFGPTTATGLAHLTDEVISHDQVTRLLASPKRDGADLWRKVKTRVREIESSAGVLIFDDTIEEKPYTDENDIVSWHFDRGISIIAKAVLSRVSISSRLCTRTPTRLPGGTSRFL